MVHIMTFLLSLYLLTQIAADTVVPLSQDEATEGTMSSEALPLIFEPFEDVTPEGAAAVTLVPGSAQPPATMATKGMHLLEADLDQLVTVETDSEGPSHAQPLLTPDWTPSWQTHPVSDLLDTSSSPGPSVSQQYTRDESVFREVTSQGLLASFTAKMQTYVIYMP